MITLLEQLHSVGRIHCDLKPDNICIGNGAENCDLSQIKLIDFGVSQSYCKDINHFGEPANDNDHIEMEKCR